MDAGLLFEGVIIGFVVAAPVGPIGVLCIRRTLVEGRFFGFVSGLGAASADAVYGLVAVLGLSFVSSLLLEGEAWLRTLGGAFLVLLGVRIFLERPAKRAAPVRRSGLFGAYASTLLLTLTNPATILSFAAILAALPGLKTESYISATLLVIGVFLGSALWWLLLSGGVGLFRARFTPYALWVNRASGTLVAAFGLLAVVRVGE